MKSTDVPATFRDMWDTRPARPRDDRMVAGVAAGIARRYDIDPVLVRVGFVVAAITGIGAVLYLAAWLVLPDTPVDPTAPPPTRHPFVMVAAVIAIAVGLGGLFDGTGKFVLPVIAVGALLFLLHVNRRDRGPVGPRPEPGPDATATAAAAATAPPSMVKDLPGMPPQPTPPSWDPLGAAPFAWDLPEPAPAPAPPPPPAPRKPPVTAVTLGAALLAGGVTAAILLLTGTMSIATIPTLFGVALAVLGAGLVVGAFLRTGRGLIPFAILLSMLTWGVLSSPVQAFGGDGFGDLTVRPTTAGAIAPSYSRAAGDIELDLTAVDLTVPAGTPAAPIRTEVRSGAGDVVVTLPPNADVTFTGTSGFGNVDFANLQQQSGPGAHLSITDLGADGVASGRPIEINVQAGAGDVEVKR